jgi:hypothetical protein
MPTDIDLLKRSPVLASVGIPYGPARHPASEWAFERDASGVPVRMVWWECTCPIHRPEIEAANAAIRERDRQL